MNQKEQISKRAVDLYEGGYNCAQSVVKALKESDYPVSDDLYNALSGLQSGIMGGCVCGALMGGVLMAGSKDQSKTKRVAAQMHKNFKDKYKTTCCRSLRNNGRCAEYVSFIAEKAVELI